MLKGQVAMDESEKRKSQENNGTTKSHIIKMYGKINYRVLRLTHPFSLKLKQLSTFGNVLLQQSIMF